MQGHIRRIGFAIVEPQIHDVPVFDVQGAGQHAVEHVLVLEAVDLLSVLKRLLIEEQHLLDADFLKGRRGFHAFPDFQDGVQGLVHVQKHLGEAQAHMVDLRLRLVEMGVDIFQPFLSHGAHIAGVVDPVASGPARDLADFRGF